jgi:hypothetical protein
LIAKDNQIYTDIQIIYSLHHQIMKNLILFILLALPIVGNSQKTAFYASLVYTSEKPLYQFDSTRTILIKDAVARAVKQETLWMIMDYGSNELTLFNDSTEEKNVLKLVPFHEYYRIENTFIEVYFSEWGVAVFYDPESRVYRSYIKSD